MDLASMSVGELEKLKNAVEKELNGRQKQQRSKALGEIKSIAAKYGLKLDEVVGQAGKRGRPAKSENAASAKPAKKSAKKTAVKKAAVKKILYRHPDNSELTWGGGRGRRPQWVKDWEAAGRSLDEIRVG